MPEGPKGERRPADVVGAAVMVAKIATGEIEDTVEDDGKDPAATRKIIQTETLPKLSLRRDNSYLPAPRARG